MSSTRSMKRVLVALSAAVLVAAACDAGPTASTEGTVPGGEKIDPAAELAESKAATEAAMKGTNRPVDPTPRPAAKGKKLAIITSAMSVSSSKVPAVGTEEAAKAAGWDPIIYDGMLQEATWPGLVRQATAADVDGIVLVAIDCAKVKQPLEEAKAAGIAITALYAFDCNDARSGGTSEPLFSASTNFGPKNADVPAFTKSYGADQANYIIADSDNQAKIIEIVAPEFTVLNYTHDGFKGRIDEAGGAEIISTLEVTQSDILTSQLQPKIEAELLRHPDATWVKSPFTYVTTLGLVQALGPRAGKLKVMGGEGFNEELELIHEGKVTAVNVISSEWNGWAAVDTLNSVFANQKPVDSGIGWTIVDKDHGLPPQGQAFEPPVDFRAAYKKAWGVS
jgi:ribose transport system substrate-binding protein